MDFLCKTVLHFVITIVVLLLLMSIVYMSFVIIDAKRKYWDNCEYLMILGGEIIGEDTPCYHLMERMETALVYLNENKNCFVVPCGGCFRFQQKKSEADIIAKYLIEHGIEGNRIILENKSTTTFENFMFALEIIKKHSCKSINETKISFLSSNYHIFRSSVIAKCCGLNNPGKVSSPTSKDVVECFVREYFVAYELMVRIITKKFI